MAALVSSMQSPAVYLTIIGDEPDLLLSFHKFHQTALSLYLSLGQLILSISKWIVARLELDFYRRTRNIQDSTIDIFKIPSIGLRDLLGLVTMDDYTRRVHSALDARSVA